MTRICIWPLVIVVATSVQTASAAENSIRVATYNSSLYSDEAGQLIRDLEGGTNDQAKKIAEVIQRVLDDGLKNLRLQANLSSLRPSAAQGIPSVGHIRAVDPTLGQDVAPNLVSFVICNHASRVLGGLEPTGDVGRAGDRRMVDWSSHAQERTWGRRL